MTQELFIRNMSGNDVLDYTPPSDRKTALIRIGDYSLFRELKKPELYAVVSEFQFLDLDSSNLMDDDSLYDFIISDADCYRILSFLMLYKTCGYDVVVHCTAGSSRSGAICKFAQDYYGYSFVDNFSTPNMMIYDKLCWLWKHSNFGAFTKVTDIIIN